MAQCAADHTLEADCVTWVPLSAKRRRQRGYDQAELLARWVGEELNLPVLPALEKFRHNQTQSDLFHMVMALPRKYRLPIYLHYYEGYSTQEIGQMLKLPKNTVCTQLKRGRELLKESLQEVDDNV